MSYALDYPITSHAPADARAAFIRKTYGHLAGAILGFIIVEYLLLAVFRDVGEGIIRSMMGGGWIVVLLAFMGISWLANYWAQSDTSVGMQYLGLSLYVLAEAVIFLPLLWIAAFKLGDKNVIPTAGFLTLATFGGLTTAVFITKKDFSFLGPILCVAGFLAMGFVLVAMFVNVSMLGLVFCFAMVALASGYILYYTSNIMHHYRTDQHVAAALALFASVALLFWYILQIVMSSSSRD